MIRRKRLALSKKLVYDTWRKEDYMNKSMEYLNKLLNDDDTVVLGVSGGPDSMCLLSLLLRVREQVNIKIVVCHVNHMVRKEALEEEAFVRKFALDNKCFFELKTLDKIEKNFEAEARKLRYEFFKEIALKYHAKYIMTAHHGDDLIETVLMKIVRGSNIKGYSGFPIKSMVDDFYLVRPLIFYTKEDIVKYLDNNNIDYRIDQSNFEMDHIRNRIRGNIIPLLKKENSNVHLKFLEYQEELLANYNYINKVALKKLEEIYVNKKLNIAEFNKLDDVIKRRVLEVIIRGIYKDSLYLITSNNTKEIINLCLSKKPNGKVSLPLMYNFVKSYNEGYFKIVKYSKIDKVLLKEAFEGNNQRLEVVKESTDTSNYTTRLLSSEVKMPLYVRTRINGDKIRIKNFNGTRKLKSVLIDEKVDKEFRDGLLLVVDSNDEIVFVPGIKKTKFDKDINEKYDIILKYKKEGEDYE